MKFHMNRNPHIGDTVWIHVSPLGYLPFSPPVNTTFRAKVVVLALEDLAGFPAMKVSTCENGTILWVDIMNCYQEE